MNEIVSLFLLASMKAAIFSGVIYLACGFLFNLDIVKQRLSNDIKAVTAFALCGLFVWYSGFDMPHELGAKKHWGGQVITSLVLAGGSRGILKLVRKLIKGEDSPVNFTQGSGTQ